jgi:GNAT superfamily N-acetyltransferase
MNDLSIAPAKLADLDRFIDMHEQVRDWLDTRGLTPLARGIYRDSAEYYGASIAQGEVYFAWVGNALAGSFRLIYEDEIVWPNAAEDALYLHGLVVLRQWSGRGLGRVMLAWCEEQIRHAGRSFLRLDCFANNPVLRNYYETQGYAGCGEIDAPYPFGVLRLQRYEKRC